MTRQLIGIDVGGTKLSVASLRGARLDTRPVTPTAATSAEALIDEIAGAVDAVRSVERASA